MPAKAELRAPTRVGSSVWLDYASLDLNLLDMMDDPKAHDEISPERRLFPAAPAFAQQPQPLAANPPTGTA